MPRARSPKRDQAYQLWIASDGKKKLKDIAAELEVSETQIRKWKNQDKWNSNVTNQGKGNVTKRKPGGQPGNKNAVGHGAPKGNQNATKHGLFSGISQRILGRFSFPWIQRIHWICCGTRLSWPTRQLCEPSILCMSETGKM